MKSFKEFCEEHGAGFEGTLELTKKYKKDTPGEKDVKKKSKDLNKS